MLKRYGKDGAQVPRKACILNCHQNGFQCALLFSTSTLFVFFFMNTILKSFLFNFLPPGPLYLIYGISWKDNSPWRAKSWWLKWTVKKGRKNFAPTTGWKGKFTCQISSAHAVMQTEIELLLWLIWNTCRNISSPGHPNKMMDDKMNFRHFYNITCHITLRSHVWHMSWLQSGEEEGTSCQERDHR